VGTKQLAFDLAGTTLWAHDHNNCWWSKVDTSTGAVTDEFQGAACLRDIGGAACAAGCALVERYLSPRPQPGAQSPPVVSPSDASHRHSPRQFGLRTTHSSILFGMDGTRARRFGWNRPVRHNVVVSCFTRNGEMKWAGRGGGGGSKSYNPYHNLLAARPTGHPPSTPAWFWWRRARRAPHMPWTTPRVLTLYCDSPPPSFSSRPRAPAFQSIKKIG